MIVLHLRNEPQPERFFTHALQWIHEAGNPYYDLFFGNPEGARDVLTRWMSRPSSEVWIGRASLLLEPEEPVGGFIGLSGADLLKCRRADMLDLMKGAGSSGRDELQKRLEWAGGLFPPPDSDEYYLSKMGVGVDHRRRGLGRRILEEFLAVGRAARFHRFRLDVCSANTAATRLYETHGFRIVKESFSEALGIGYLSMAFTQERE